MFSTIMDISNEPQQDVIPEEEFDDEEDVDEDEPSPPDVLKAVVVEEWVTKVFFLNDLWLKGIP